MSIESEVTSSLDPNKDSDLSTENQPSANAESGAKQQPSGTARSGANKPSAIANLGANQFRSKSVSLSNKPSATAKPEVNKPSSQAGSGTKYPLATVNHPSVTSNPGANQLWAESVSWGNQLSGTVEHGMNQPFASAEHGANKPTASADPEAIQPLAGSWSGDKHLLKAEDTFTNIKGVSGGNTPNPVSHNKNQLLLMKGLGHQVSFNSSNDASEVVFFF